MARINLLPWRVERRKQRQKEFGILLGMSALGAVLVSFLMVLYYSGQISGQNERNKYMEDQIALVQKQIDEIKLLDEKKAKLLARKEIIEKLQANRSQMVHLFDSLVRTIPDGVILTQIKQDQETLTLQGRAQSNARVSTYMRNLEGSGWMTNPDLSIIEAKGEDRALPNEFRLTVKLANPNAPKDEDGDGIPDAPAAAPADPGTAPAPAPATTPEATPQATTTPASSNNSAPAASATQGASS